MYCDSDKENALLSLDLLNLSYRSDWTVDGSRASYNFSEIILSEMGNVSFKLLYVGKSN
jgi:hypothetical protein